MNSRGGRYLFAFLFGLVGWFGGYVIAVLLSGIFVWPMIVGVFAGLGIDAGYRRRPNLIRGAVSACAGLLAGAVVAFLLSGLTDSLPSWVGVVGLMGGFVAIVAAGVLPAEKIKGTPAVTRRGWLMAGVVLGALVAITFGLLVWLVGLPWDSSDAIDGSWELVSLVDGGVETTDLPAVLEIDSVEGRAVLNGPCNTHSGRARFDGSRLHVRLIHSTAARCIDDDRQAKANMLARMFSRGTIRVGAGGSVLVWEHEGATATWIRSQLAGISGSDTTAGLGREKIEYTRPLLWLMEM